MGRHKNFDEGEVLDRAIELFKVNGFRGTAPNELVEYTGLSRSSLYATFGDKYSLLLKALHRYREVTKQSLEAIKAGTNDPLEGISMVLDLSIKGCYDDSGPKGCFLTTSAIEFGPNDSEAMEIVKNSYLDTRELLLHFVTLGQAKKVFTNRMEAGIMADFLQNTISGIVVSSQAGMDLDTCRKVVASSLAVLQIKSGHKE